MSSVHSYSDIVTFGGHCDDLLVVVIDNNCRSRKSERLLFSMSKAKVSVIFFY